MTDSDDPSAISPSQPASGLAALRARFAGLGEYRAPIGLFFLALVLAAVIAFLPAERTASRPASSESTAGIDLTAFSVLPGQPGEAPVLAEPAVAMDDARSKNAAIPFVSGQLEAANPFKFGGSALDFQRATECLALAAMAEAGPSDVGQRAVIQVILNRARHPAFARTVCGVVFQGSERRTGCQFTFTCDGSLARRYSEEAWRMARNRAIEGLRGYVFAPVSTATHYHTDWVFPYWSPKLEKLARIETHLFFRWPGYWGSKAAARMAYAGGETPNAMSAQVPEPAQTLAPLPSGMPQAAPSIASSAPAIAGGELVMRDPSGKANFVLIGGADPEEATTLSRKLCTVPGTCRVLGWDDRTEIPARFPVPAAARARLKFSYSRGPDGAEIILYDCERYPGLPRERCIPRGQ